MASVMRIAVADAVITRAIQPAGRQWRKNLATQADI